MLEALLQVVKFLVDKIAQLLTYHIATQNWKWLGGGVVVVVVVAVVVVKSTVRCLFIQSIFFGSVFFLYP